MHDRVRDRATVGCVILHEEGPGPVFTGEQNDERKCGARPIRLLVLLRFYCSHQGFSWASPRLMHIDVCGTDCVGIRVIHAIMASPYVTSVGMPQTECHFWKA